MSTVRMLPSLKRTRSAPRNSTRFAAQYPARGHPCERFAAGLATRLAHHSGPRRLAIPFLAEDLHLLFFRQRDWRTPVRVTKELFCSCSIARAAGLLIDMRRTSAGRLGRAKSDYMTLTRGTVADSLLLAGNQASSPVIGLAASLSGKISPASDRSSTRRWSFSKPLSTARRSVVGLRSRL